jgi:hypothetical protein
MKKIILIVFFSITLSCGQKNEDSHESIIHEVSNESLNRVEPPNWWVGMNEKSLQLLIHHDNPNGRLFLFYLNE